MTKLPDPAHLNSRDPDAALMQRRMREAIADYALARLDDDHITTFAGLTTEFVGGMIELMHAHGLAPTEAQFVEVFTMVATVVAQGAHLESAQMDKAGHA